MANVSYHSTTFRQFQFPDTKSAREGQAPPVSKNGVRNDAEGQSKARAFWAGTLSGAVEPLGALATILASRHIVPAMPYLLSFAAGAMFYVVVEELIPEMSEGEHSNIGVVLFSVGFTLMMALDVALG